MGFQKIDTIKAADVGYISEATFSLFLFLKVGLFMSGKKDNAQSENKHVQNKKEEVGQTQLTK